MTNFVTRIAVLLFAALAVVPVFAEGTRISLEALPEYVERVFMPVVPQATNTLQIGSLRAEQVIEAPRPFDVRVVNGAFVVYSDGGNGAGYAKVRAGGRALTLTLVNVVPYDAMRHGNLDGYRIGEYASQAMRGLEQYERPKGFVRLSHGNGALFVSDHYRMRDFQCKLDGTTKFMVLRTDALVKLEVLQHELASRYGVHFDRFAIMSGYRTPYYNAKIGNETGFSRHLYGDAMDIYVDQDRNGKMDDINRDGRVDTNDARFLLRVAESIDNSTQWGWLKGGAGVYHANAAHGPYVHVDARGYVARWGAIEETAGGGRVVASR
ncbi:MAG TPA: D-Ala-D-Ala carboxypeptidase family metallohydrolase [Thermoanaerobaculia bacterium]|nr:D-Ala-D-Ala carboxypeptidase family metallohydrolase [Thermoanaerobaculia bacterium]